jgi:L-2-hydroxycarboxylate dehydrogenase (NAD+)
MAKMPSSADAFNHESDCATNSQCSSKAAAPFFSAMQIDGFFIDKDEFKKQIDDWIQVFRNATGPLIPGDPEREAETIRSKAGIPLLKPVVNDC